MATSIEIQKGQEEEAVRECLEVEVGAAGDDVLKLIPNEEGDVWAVAFRDGDAICACIVLTEWRDEGWFYVKVIEEEAGPLCFDVPIDVLGLLTPTTSVLANEWRSACRKKAQGAALQ